MTTVIRPRYTVLVRDLRELWEYHELLYFFIWKELKIRYKQTAVGVAWAIFQPFVTMVVFSVFFGALVGVPSDGVPYPIFVYAGLLYWQFFSFSLSQVSNSLVVNQALLTKVYFPRLLLPISAVAVNLIDFFVASIILIAMMIYYNFVPIFTSVVILPLLVLLTFSLAVGSGLILATVNVKYRDVKYVLPFFIQTLMFVTPVIYPPSILGNYSWMLALNPMTGIIKAARSTLFGTPPVNWTLLALSGLVTVVILIVGIWYFKKTERTFADLI